MYTYTHVHNTHTHTHIYIYIYIYILVGISQSVCKNVFHCFVIIDNMSLEITTNWKLI